LDPVLYRLLLVAPTHLGIEIGHPALCPTHRCRVLYKQVSCASLW